MTVADLRLQTLKGAKAVVLASLRPIGASRKRKPIERMLALGIGAAIELHRWRAF